MHATPTRPTRRPLRRTVRGTAQAACLTLAVLGLAACQGGGDATPATEGGTIPEFTIASIAAFGSLDNTKPNAASGASLVTEPLARIKHDGTLEPVLAESIEAKADSVVVRLREGVTFSDGDPVTSEDVAFSIERSADPASAPALAAQLGSVGSVERTDETTITVKTTRPDPTLLNSLAQNVLVVKKSYVEKSGEEYGSPSAPPIGTGPYEVDTFGSSKIEMVRNADYWGEAPDIEKVTYTFLPDSDTARLAMGSGEIDLQWVITGAEIKRWQQVGGANVAVLPSTNLSFLSLDVTAPPFEDPHVRQAIALDVDRENVNEVANGGFGTQLQGLVSPNQLASVCGQQEAEDFLASLPQASFDPDAAADELAASSHPDGFSFTVPAPPQDQSYAQTLLLSLQEELKPMGVDLKIDPLSYPEWVQQVTAHEDLGMQVWTYGSSNPDPAQVLTMFVGKATATAGGLNTANYAPPALEKSLAVLASSFDDEERCAAAQEIVGAVAEDAAYVPLFAPNIGVVTSDGFTYDESAGDPSDYSNGAWVHHVSRTS